MQRCIEMFTQPTFTTHTKCSDIIYVIDITRRHVGGILDMNKDCVNCGNLTKFFFQDVSQTVFFDWQINPHTIPYKFTTLHCCNRNTSNTALFFTVGRMTSLTPCNVRRTVAPISWNTGARTPTFTNGSARGNRK